MNSIKKLRCALICMELTISGNNLLEMGYEYGDIVTVTIDGQAYDTPVVSSYNDVDSGCMLCRVIASDAPADSTVKLSINMGNLAAEPGIATKTAIEEASASAGITTMAMMIRWLSPSPWAKRAVMRMSTSSASSFAARFGRTIPT